MRKLLFCTILGLAVSFGAHAASDNSDNTNGTAKGAAAGALAGHEMGNGHAKAGAATGAAIGHHDKAKAEKESGKQ